MDVVGSVGELGRIMGGHKLLDGCLHHCWLS